MRRREYLATAVSTIGLSGCSAPSPTSLPNIVLFMTDDQGHDDAGYAGNSLVRTPVIDEMAENNLCLNRSYSTAPVCTPTRASVLTGRHSNRMGAFNYGHTITQREETVAELLGSGGYTTGFFGKWHIGSVQKGAENNPGNAGFDEWAASPNFYDNDPMLSVNGDVKQFVGGSSMVTTELALDFIRDQAGSEEPFLAVIWTASPHDPYELTDELSEQFADAEHPGFLGELAGVDRALGKLRSGLRKEGVAENTLLWFTSDNGSKGEYNQYSEYRGAKGTLREGGIRVPGIIEWPTKIPSPRQSNHLVTTTDILPTLAEIAGVPLPDDRPIDGESLLPHIDREREQREKSARFWFASAIPGQLVFSDEIMKRMLAAQQRSEDWTSPYSQRTAESIDQALKLLDSGGSIGNAALIDGTWKLYQTGRTQFELYDLKSDPGESEDVFSTHQERGVEMKQELASWRDSVKKSMAKTASMV